jgi:hypothetical protein
MPKNRVFLGLGSLMVRLPTRLFSYLVRKDASNLRKSLEFMTENHHIVRDFVVRELPEYSRPLSPALIAEKTGLTLDQVVSILGELERRMTFVARNANGEVLWAYPVTADETPHRVHFTTGQTINAA